jgi:hypothetical protein
MQTTIDGKEVKKIKKKLNNFYNHISKDYGGLNGWLNGQL